MFGAWSSFICLPLFDVPLFTLIDLIAMSCMFKFHFIFCKRSPCSPILPLLGLLMYFFFITIKFQVEQEMLNNNLVSYRFLVWKRRHLSRKLRKLTISWHCGSILIKILVMRCIWFLMMPKSYSPYIRCKGGFLVVTLCFFPSCRKPRKNFSNYKRWYQFLVMKRKGHSMIRLVVLMML